MYKVVFDAAEHGYRTWWFSLPGALFLAGAAVTFVLARRWQSTRERRAAVVLGAILCVVGLVWIDQTLAGTHGEYERLVAGLRRHTFRVVEGPVTGFAPRGVDGHPVEHWSVDGHYYEISPAEVTSAFNTPGIVHAGDRVRIADIDGAIARLEIMR